MDSLAIDVLGTVNTGSILVVDDVACDSLVVGQYLDNYLVVCHVGDIVDTVTVVIG